MMALSTWVNWTEAKFCRFESVEYARSTTAHWGLPFYIWIKRNCPWLENDNYCFYKLNIVHDGSTGIGHLNWSTIWHYVLRGQHSGIKCLLKVHELRRRDGYDNGYTVQRWKTIITISTNPISWFIGRWHKSIELDLNFAVLKTLSASGELLLTGGSRFI